jgi:Ca2+-binding EF-hand superfamily protein
LFSIEEVVQLCDLASGDFGLERPRAPLREELTRLGDKDGRIARDAMLDYVMRNYPPFNIAANLTPGTAAAPALFGLLDADHDGQLSRSELTNAARHLSIRDFDGDELFTERELIIDPTQHTTGTSTEELIDDRRSSEPDKLIGIGSGAAMTNVATAMLRRYDRDNDGKVGLQGSAVELSLSAEVASRLDANRDNQLDAIELQAFGAEPPASVLVLSFGSAGLARRAAGTQRENAALRVRKKIDGGYKLHLGDVQIDVNRNNRDPRQSSGTELRFAALDADQNGYLDRVEARTNPLLAAGFEGMDTDRDEKVTPGELRIYADAQNAAAAMRVRVQVIDRGQDLFSVLDANGDGLLTPRELNAAPALIDSDDGNGDGALGGLEIPVRWALDVARGSQRTVQGAPVSQRVRATQLAGTDAGPAWFRNMDRNHDGDLTPREFLGSAADFAAADADQDRLVDAREAAAFKEKR